MIKSFKGKWAKKIWERIPAKQMLAIYKEAYDGLVLLNSINDLRQLEKMPNLKLHHLTGDRQGQRAFWIGKTKYRICFIWEKSNAYEVEITDYH